MWIIPPTNTFVPAPRNKVIYWENKTEDRLFKTHAPRALIRKSNEALEKEIATHSSILAWKFHRQRRLEGYRPWGHKERDTTAHLSVSMASHRRCTILLETKAINHQRIIH